MNTPVCSVCNAALTKADDDVWNCDKCKAVYHDQFEIMKYEDEFTSSHEDEFPELGGISTGSSLMAADDDIDGSIVDMLYKNPRHAPNRGEGSNTWE